MSLLEEKIELSSVPCPPVHCFDFVIVLSMAHREDNDQHYVSFFVLC